MFRLFPQLEATTLATLRGERGGAGEEGPTGHTGEAPGNGASAHQLVQGEASALSESSLWVAGSGSVVTQVIIV